MKIHEYQAKELLRRFDVPTPEGRVADTAREAEEAWQELGGGKVVVKAQIHAGGRGKGGGIKPAETKADVRDAADAILGMQLVTPQTGEEGRKVRRVLVERASDIRDELYVGVTLDRSRQVPVMMCSTEGGVDIEKVAAETPEKIFREPVDPAFGRLHSFQSRNLARRLGVPGPLQRSCAKTLVHLSRLYYETDASLAEINPLVVTGDDVIALDAKINFDDNALYRHQDILKWRDLDEEDPQEVEAGEHGLSYVSLDGNIGCLVNGAGLAMGTMDIIKHAGGEPANFLDVGGGATTEQVKAAFTIILEDPKVKAILVNIFGGIMKCDVIAEGVIAAAGEMGLEVPLVVRLEGTNVDKGREMLEKSDLNIITAEDMSDAARKVVEQAGA